jgi:hypothetical protein
MSPVRLDLASELAAVADDVAPALALPGTDELLQALVATTRRVYGAAAVSILSLDLVDDALVYRASDGAGAENVRGVRLEAGRGLSWYVASSGQAISVEEVRQDPRFATDIAQRLGYVPERMLVFPVADARGEVLGVLSILDRDSSIDGATALELGTSFARQVALCFEVGDGARLLGATLLRAVADAVQEEHRDLATALRRRASARRAVDAEVAAVAARIGELRRLGPGIAATGGRILDELITHGRAARGRRR